VKKRLWHLVVGTRGGLKRAEIIALVRRRPYNAHEISRLMGVDYKTARHHLRVLVENGILDASEDHYGTIYVWSPAMQASAATWQEIWDAVGQNASGRVDKKEGEP